MIDTAIPGYTILEKINDGGMASVYLALQESVGRRVALKIMKPELDDDPQFHQRFQREAKIVGQMSHPNIIVIYDSGRYQGLNYISMDYLPNGSLQEKMARGIVLPDALLVMKAMASALDHAHQKGFVHRDIKPENVLFRADNTAVLTDFGIARTLRQDSSVTQLGIMVGTPIYISPEQAQGKPVDARSDFYSLGVVFFEMLMGVRPFSGDDAISLALQHINEPVPLLSQAYATYQPIIEKLLAKNPDDRFQSGADLIAALDACTEQANAPAEFAQMSGKLAHSTWRVMASLWLNLFQQCRHFVTKIIVRMPENSARATRPLSTDVNPQLEQPLSIGNVDSNTLVTASPAISNVPRRGSSRTMWIFVASLIALVVMSALGLMAGWWAISPASNLKRAQADNRYALTVIAEPSTSRVRILNIADVYQPGIELLPGSYQIEVTSPGYEKYVAWFELGAEDERINVHLTKNSDGENNNRILLPEMVLINPGTFVYGDLQQAKKVTLTEPYFISVYEITFDQYDNFARATQRPLPDDNGWGRGAKPVINVRWSDAYEYAQWLSERTGESYRLPSELEWEYAARAGTETAYWWGDEANGRRRANCRDCKSMIAGLWSRRTETVGAYAPNPFGVYDTAGNVAEWVDDCAEKKSTQQSCDYRLVRGGSYFDSVDQLTSYATLTKLASGSDNATGFRVVRDQAERVQRKKLLDRLFNFDR